MRWILTREGRVRDESITECMDGVWARCFGMGMDSDRGGFDLRQ